MKYQANPVVVDAWKIIRVGATDEHGTTLVQLDNGRDGFADSGMLARYTPVVGDYWVEQEDGYVYINPKAVFERKYSPQVVVID